MKNELADKSIEIWEETQEAEGAPAEPKEGEVEVGAETGAARSESQPGVPRPASGPVSGATYQHRTASDPLPSLPVARGNRTNAITFVTDNLLHRLHKEGRIPEQKLYCRRLQWKPDTDLELPKGPALRGHYRMVFAKEGQTYLPVQHCVDEGFNCVEIFVLLARGQDDFRDF